MAGLLLYNILSPASRDYEYVLDTVERGDVNRVVSASGKVRALNTINVGAEVSGQVTQVFVDYNSPVRKGQLLALIDPTRVQARVQQGEAQLALARAGLQQAQANVAKADNDLLIQQRNFTRRKSLAGNGFVSKADLDAADAQLSAARAAASVNRAQVSSARAQISQASAELSSAQLDLSRTRIIAPSSGVIINKLVEPGSTVTAGFQTPNLFEIATDITQMQIEASVDEADIGQVKVGQPVNFSVDSYPDTIFRATVRQVRQAAVENQNVVSYLVIADVPNLDGKLLPGMTANVDIITGSRPKVVRVPSSALRFRPRTADLPDEARDSEKKRSDGAGKPGHMVFVSTEDPYRPAMREVTIGVEGDEFTEIVSGLRPGEKILVRSKSLKPKKDQEDSDNEDGGDDSAS
ncbi:efflux RND transporter periplasmic adaptor subunit [Sphingopyxis sp.]|uniref:efflux RND transporter periplasmic adaptor subunit n=1 Tax=Sphingopyxis sp. TaxID=1908224 RepID=UPI001D6861E3|nr:efflux RND transporter periplasmic adaptor subunit [Sphingopyxis sp.]MBW8295748.1 efflux RND transporter periplasmic adaptor subunit [Sphingopyxis sp.]